MFARQTRRGTENPLSSIIWGQRAGQGDWFEHVSSLDGSQLQRTRFLAESELDLLVPPEQALPPISPEELQAFSIRLYTALESRKTELETALLYETGFIGSDCQEIVEGTLTYIERFAEVLPPAPQLGLRYADGPQQRQIRLATVPWGTIAIILPQNASLIVGVTCLLSALATGNRVILRCPTQSSLTAALMADALEEAQPPHNAVSQVICRAKQFTQALHRSSSVLLHYMGSSRHATSVLSESFSHRQSAIVDGEGNVWVWVGPDADVERSVEILTAGALRYNGQTCTSINGALIHPERYEEIRDALVLHWQKLRWGNPLAEEVEVGPLADEAQAQWCEERIQSSGGQILCGGTREASLLSPTLVENPDWGSELVTQGLFGSAMWLRAATAEEFVQRWRSNHYPLCAGVLSLGAEANWWLTRLPNLARLSLNGDPSVEHVLEPWGGYPSSGVNPVSIWAEKYRRLVAVDELAP